MLLVKNVKITKHVFNVEILIIENLTKILSNVIAKMDLKVLMVN